MSDNMARDLLIVEDDQILLSSYGTRIKIDLGIEPFLAETPEEALKIIENYHIKVLITDFDMSNVSNINGVDLVKKVRNDLHSNIPCIMLTGYTTLVNAQDAVNLGFFNIIDKNDTENKLIPTIRRALNAYEMASRNEAFLEVNQLIWSKTRLFGFKEKVDLKLLRVSSFIENFVFDNQWVTQYVAQIGISQKIEIEIEHISKSSIEYDFNEQLFTDIGLNSNQIFESISLKVGAKISTLTKKQFVTQVKQRAKYSIEIKDLQNVPNVQGLILQSRNYESTPVYNRINCVFQITCSCCKIPRILDLSLIVPIDKIALRQTEYYNKAGATRHIYTGFIQGITS